MSGFVERPKVDNIDVDGLKTGLSALERQLLASTRDHGKALEEAHDRIYKTQKGHTEVLTSCRKKRALTKTRLNPDKKGFCDIISGRTFLQLLFRSEAT